MSPTLFVPLLLAFWVPLASAADAFLPSMARPPINAESISIEGQWEPGSRVYEGSPGIFTISKHTIYFGHCEQPFTVVNDKVREDGFWNGTDQLRQVKRYREISIRVLPNPKCKGIPDQVFRFFMPEFVPCSASLMLYASEKDLQNDHWKAWGGYYNETCMHKMP